MSPTIEKLVAYGLAAWVCLTCNSLAILGGIGGIDEGGYVSPVFCRTLNPISKYICQGKMAEADPMELLTNLFDLFCSPDGEEE